MFVSSSTCAYEIRKGNQASRSDPSLLQSDLHSKIIKIKCVFVYFFLILICVFFF
ncbi:hypothetical protein F2Q69_00035601 [Brassica cretica]|uniref:Uncharacterized protein n=2 Tax=Brassica cretica TaxID=69181 RepID=A0ABQ7BN00_BRACR|nr:hypothetical protein DY000_02040178 [Brassica cretica]KAF3600036.1 hypothetical protein F2Q69_00035601 [Brassica cretica]